MSNQQSRKIAIVGVGGVGGFLAGAIGSAYEEQLTLVARGVRLDTLKEQGYTFSVSASTRYHVESAPSPSTYYYLSKYVK